MILIGYEAGEEARADLDLWRKEKSCFCQELNPSLQTRSPSQYRMGCPDYYY
jgi:hypothetical protein